MILEDPKDKPLDRKCLNLDHEEVECSDVLEHMVELSDIFLFNKEDYQDVFGEQFPDRPDQLSN